MMLQLDKLPVEILGTIAENIHMLEPRDSLVKPNLLNFILTSRRIYNATSPCLYHKFIYHGSQDPNGYTLQRYIIALRNQLFGEHVREIVLRDWYWSVLDEIWTALDMATDSEICTPDRLGSCLCQAAIHLRKLTIDYPPDAHFLDVYLPTVQELWVRPVHCPWDHTPGGQAAIDFPIDGPLALDFLPYVLKWPSLEHLCLEATSTYNDEILSTPGIPLQSSPITSIKLRLGNFASEALSHLCSAVTSLKAFTYVPTVQKDLADQDLDMGSAFDQHPKASEVARALLQHAHCLQSLNLARPGICWSGNADTMETLRVFTELKTLRIDATMLLGWKHCEHNGVSHLGHGHVTTGDTPSARAFGALLPPLIKTLIVVIDRHFFQQEQDRHVLDLIQGIATEIASERLKNLQTLRLELTASQYCWSCVGQTTNLQPQRLHLPASDMASVLESLAQTGCKLDIGSSSCLEDRTGDQPLPSASRHNTIPSTPV